MHKIIYRLNGDSGVWNKIIDGLRNRKLSQEFIYSGNGASNYLNYVSQSFLKGGTVNNNQIHLNPWKNLLKKYSLSNEEIRDIYIGVACGDSTRDIQFMKSLNKKNVLYIGVDLSSEMIDKSKKNLENENFDYILIQSDIFNPDLIQQIDMISNKNDHKSFLFLGGTFGNFKTTVIVDLLGSYLKKGEKLYIDTFVKTKKAEDEFKLHEYYIDKCKKSTIFLDFILSGFKYISFPLEKGEITVKTSKDEQVGLFGIHFNLKMKENIDFSLNGNSVIFSAEEEIGFLSVIYYEDEKLKNFMNIHHFNFIDKDLNNGVLGQFIFEKE